eukprot:GHVU01061348.1.p1 GENE.GHVU01061348.1~~GHVU01061348.1.p1  ORF type:complete len:135 (+),score=5.96 GHVU01061348.1:211-615(+)
MMNAQGKSRKNSESAGLCPAGCLCVTCVCRSRESLVLEDLTLLTASYFGQRPATGVNRTAARSHSCNIKQVIGGWYWGDRPITHSKGDQFHAPCIIIAQLHRCRINWYNCLLLSVNPFPPCPTLPDKLPRSSLL